MCVCRTRGGYRDFDDTFRERIHCFLQQVADGAAPDEIDGSGEDGLAALRIATAARRSAAQDGARIEL